MDTTSLKRGQHASPEAGMCAMELAAYLAGEPHSDEPKCVDPTIRDLMIRWNDRLPDDEARTRWLLDLIPLTLGTAGSEELSQRRSWACADWLIRECLPLFLDLHEKTQEHALRLRLFPQVTIENIEEVQILVNDAQEITRSLKYNDTDVYDAATSVDVSCVAKKQALTSVSEKPMRPCKASFEGSAKWEKVNDHTRRQRMSMLQSARKYRTYGRKDYCVVDRDTSQRLGALLHGVRSQIYRRTS